MVFTAALYEYLAEGLADAVRRHELKHPIQPLAVDRYVAMSALQKAVRRGRTDLALRSAATLLEASPRAFWRRLGIIAFEDVGVADIDLVGWIVIAMGDRALRRKLGTDRDIISALVCRMSEADMDRSSDDLVMQVEGADWLEEDRLAIADLPLGARVRIAADETTALERAGLAGWLSIGTDKIAGRNLPEVSGCRDSFFDGLIEAGVSRTAVEISRLGLKRTGCILAAFTPLLYRARGAKVHPVKDDDLPKEAMIGEVPGWVYDIHTRKGLSAFSRYLKRSSRMQAFLNECAIGDVPLHRIVGNLVFRMESGLGVRRVRWPEAMRLKRQADLMRDGLPKEHVDEGLSILREEIDLLNKCRAETLGVSLR